MFLPLPKLFFVTHPSFLFLPTVSMRLSLPRECCRINAFLLCKYLKLFLKTDVQQILKLSHPVLIICMFKGEFVKVVRKLWINEKDMHRVSLQLYNMYHNHYATRVSSNLDYIFWFILSTRDSKSFVLFSVRKAGFLVHFFSLLPTRNA